MSNKFKYLNFSGISKIFTFKILKYICFSLSTIVHAHEEPAMTLYQRKEKIREKNLYVKLKIRTIKVVVVDKYENASILLIEKLSSAGLPIEQHFYGSDAINKTVKFFYDKKNNMIGQYIYDYASNNVFENHFFFSHSNFVIGGKSLKNSIIEHSFEYIHNKDKNLITFIKKDSQGSEIYRIIYNFKRNYNKTDYNSATKITSNGTIEIEVEKTFDQKSKIIKKIVCDNVKDRTYWYEYYYDTKDRLVLLKHFDAQGLRSQTEYSYDDNGLLLEQIISNNAGFVKKYVYSYN